MSYCKIISYGNYIEVYEYEKDVVILRGRSGKGKGVGATHSESADLGANGENTLSERQLGKRQDNTRRASMAFRRIVAANLGRDVTPPLLVTLTYRDNFTDLTGAYRHFGSFIQTLRYQFGKTFKYVCVPEFQKRGAVHFHALFWSLPKEIFLLERQTRAIAKLWGRGYVYMKMTDGDNKLSFYLSKYMAKAFVDPRLKNQKCYVTSRNIQRPIVQSGTFPAWIILDEYGVGEPIKDREYETKWLGKGRYRLFDTSQNDENK
jgi:hypothetical protein